MPLQPNQMFGLAAAIGIFGVGIGGVYNWLIYKERGAAAITLIVTVILSTVIMILLL